MWIKNSCDLIVFTSEKRRTVGRREERLLGGSGHRSQNKVTKEVGICLGPGCLFIQISTVTLTTPNFPPRLSLNTTQKASVCVSCMLPPGPADHFSLSCAFGFGFGIMLSLSPYVWTSYFGISLAFSVYQQGCRNQFSFSAYLLIRVGSFCLLGQTAVLGGKIAQ